MTKTQVEAHAKATYSKLLAAGMTTLTEAEFVAEYLARFFGK